MKKISIFLFFLMLVLSAFIAVAQTSNSEELILYLDPGHGGYDGGACVKEVKEATITLEIAKKIKEILEENHIKVFMTRDKDEDLSGEEFIKREDMIRRVNMINNSNACLAISIHLNKFHIEKYSGAQVFYSQTNEFNKLLAQTLQNNLKLHLKNTDREIVCRNNIFLLNKVVKPCCIIECGFMSNPKEFSLLQTEEYQYKLAYSIYYGIEDYVKLY